MLSEQEIISFWDGDAYRWPMESVAQVNVPDSAKRFLSVVGFPTAESEWTLRFPALAGALPRVEYKAEAHVFGYDDVVPLCIAARGGEVLCIDNRISAAFVSSSIHQFGSLLVRYEGYRREVRAIGDIPENEGRIQRIIDRTEQLMREDDLGFPTNRGRAKEIS